MKGRIIFLGLFTMIAYVIPLSAAKKVTIGVYVEPAPLWSSQEGFVDGSDVWLKDSVRDIQSAIARTWSPTKGCPGSAEKVEAVKDPKAADFTLTVAQRGSSIADFGLRTKLPFYEGVSLATIPSRNVARWISVILSAGSYRKELIAWSNGGAVLSGGSWKADAYEIAKDAVCWAMANETTILQRRNHSAQ